MMAALPAASTLESAALLERIEALIAENKQLWQAIERLSEDIAEDRRRIAAQEAIQRPAPTSTKIHERKMRRVESILLAHNNQFMSFADMGKLLGYGKETRRQNMTHLARVFKQFPERYEVKDSKLGGKKVRLVPEYLNHILNGGV